MKSLLAGLSAAILLVAAVSASSRPSPSGGERQPSLFSPPREVWLYGHIRSVTRTGARYELRFDPAWWLGGTTANRAAVEDGRIKPGEVVPNDYYVRDETRRVLTYRVAAAARATVVTAGSAGLRSTAVPLSELDRLLDGDNPRRRRLLVPVRRAGFWIRVAVDTIRSLDQQYQP
ncbi:MAG: hypothetical protein M3321_05305 [Actinomycetota bacterium]|nr:hypothetical protein [Actinomycetota bacterium]